MRIIAMSFFFFATPLWGVFTQVWEVDNFGRCELTNVKLDTEGKATLGPAVKELWQNPETYIWDIVRHKEEIYVGTGGKGRVYKIGEKGGKLLFDTKEGSVFSLCYKDDNLYVGTGPEGKVFVVNKEGEGELFYNTKEKYIWDMAIDGEGNLYLGTGIRGKVFKINNKKEITTIFETKTMNVTCVEIWNEEIYIGTGEGGKIYKVNKEGKVFSLYDSKEEEVNGIVLWGGDVYFSVSKDTLTKVYKIYKDRRVEEIFTTKGRGQGMSKYEGEILVAVGHKVYKITQKDKVILFASFPSPISCLTGRLVGTSEVGKIYCIEKENKGIGCVISYPYDTKFISTWGKLEAKVLGDIKFETRVGNVSKPDTTWEEWKEVNRNGEVQSTNARFIQWRAIIKEEGDKLMNVKLYYLTQNLPPKIDSIKIAEKKENLQINWYVRDPNSDSLSYDLYVKLTTEEKWRVVVEGLTKSSYSLNPKTLPDGVYRFKLVVSDERSNPKEIARKVEKTTKEIIIDNTPPVIKITEKKQGVLIFRAIDNMRIKTCTYLFDGCKFWSPLLPGDKIFDEKEEKFTLHTQGKHKVVIKVKDEKGNTSLKSIFLK